MLIGCTKRDKQQSGILYLARDDHDSCHFYCLVLSDTMAYFPNCYFGDSDSSQYSFGVWYYEILIWINIANVILKQFFRSIY